MGPKMVQGGLREKTSLDPALRCAGSRAWPAQKKCWCRGVWGFSLRSVPTTPPNGPQNEAKTGKKSKQRAVEKSKSIFVALGCDFYRLLKPKRRKNSIRTGGTFHTSRKQANVLKSKKTHGFLMLFVVWMLDGGAETGQENDPKPVSKANALM